MENLPASFCSQELRKLIESIEDIKPAVHFLCKSGNFSCKSAELQQFTELCGSLYLGCLPSYQLVNLLENILRFYRASSEHGIQQSMKDWSISHIQHLLIVPPDVLQANISLTVASSHIFLEKILSALEASLLDEKPKIPGYLLLLLCKVGKTMIEENIKSGYISSLLCILRNFIFPLDIYRHPSVADFLEFLAEKFEKGDLCLSDKEHINLWLLCPDTLEFSTLSLFNNCCVEMPKGSICLKKLQSCVESSLLPQACAQESCLFQHVINIMISALIKAQGNRVVAASIAVFIMCVENNCSTNSLVSLFPSGLQPLALLLHIPPSALPSSMYSTHISHFCRMALRSISQMLCSENEIIILLILFPLWYQLMLKTALMEERLTYLLEKLWNRITHSKNNDFFLMAHTLSNSKWFAC